MNITCHSIKWIAKELSLCHKLCFSKPYIFGFQCLRPLKFQTMNSVRSNNVSLKYQRFATLGSKDIGIINPDFMAKTQFLLRSMDKEWNLNNLTPLTLWCTWKPWYGGARGQFYPPL